jgi:hypothetical protein
MPALDHAMGLPVLFGCAADVGVAVMAAESRLSCSGLSALVLAQSEHERARLASLVDVNSVILVDRLAV